MATKIQNENELGEALKQIKLVLELANSNPKVNISIENVTNYSLILVNNINGAALTITNDKNTMGDVAWFIKESGKVCTGVEST